MRGLLGSAATAAWSTSTTYPTGAHVAHDGGLWRAGAVVARGFMPQGVGDGSTADRDLLLDQRTGFALSADVTGGYAGDTYTVTSTANSGAGTLRAGLEHADAKWIIFDPSLDGQTISLTTTDVHVKANKTVDGRGVPNLVIQPTRGIFQRGVLSPNNAGSTVNFTDGIANIIWAYVTVDGAMALNNRGVFMCAYGCDKMWFHHVDVSGGTDSIITIVDVAKSGSGNPNHWPDPVDCRVTLSWCKIGPQPRLSELALWPVVAAPSDDNRPQNGKALHLGLDPEDSANPDKLQVTVDHCWLYGTSQRNPLLQHGRCHWLNSHVDRWGMPPGLVGSSEAALIADYAALGKTAVLSSGGAVGSNPKSGAELLCEGSIYSPYETGDGHVIDASWPMLSPDVQAVFEVSSQYLKVDGVWLRNGATKSADRSPGSIFTPPYDYTVRSADESLLYDLDVGAGNVQPWVSA